jgi:hypothetical protein
MFALTSPPLKFKPIELSKYSCGSCDDEGEVGDREEGDDKEEDDDDDEEEEEEEEDG